MNSTLNLALAVGFCLAGLMWAIHKSAQAMLIAPPIKVMVNDFRVVFAQRGWTFVTASIEQKQSHFKGLDVWRTIYAQERRFGEGSWDYSLRQLDELPGHELERLASKFVDDYLTTLTPTEN